jgi:LAO/AO transport system kinase
MSRLLPAGDYVEGVRARDRALIGRALTLVESTVPEHRALAGEVLGRLLPFSGHARRVGITGSPGVGKSTLIDALGVLLLEKGHRLAVLAVDPTSQRSKGSILGDKTRMENLSADSRCFIRPSPSGGMLGGVASRTREAMIVLEAAGYDVIFVETVGVGQSEVMVRAMVDAFVLLVLPGSGDELQGVKRGIMELSDLVVVTKADGASQFAAEATRLEHERGLHFLPPSTAGWTTPALCCSALEQSGLEELWQAVERLLGHAEDSGALQSRRRGQQREWMRDLLEEKVLELLRADPLVGEAWPGLQKEVEEGRLLPASAAEQLAALFVRGTAETSRSEIF